MVMHEVIREAESRGVKIDPNQIRYAIGTGRIPRPPLNGMRVFEFSSEHVEKIVSYFSGPRVRRNAKNKPAVV